jgi:putative peptidoglycan lipid II flippase
MVVMTVVKIPLLYLCSAQLRPEHVVIGVLLVNSLTFVVGAVLGQMWLWVRLGRLQSMRVVKAIMQTVVAGAVGILLGFGAGMLVRLVLPDGLGDAPTAWVLLVVESLITLVVAFGLLAVFKVPELNPAWQRITRLVRRG